jgi:hypothetical protein
MQQAFDTDSRFTPYHLQVKKVDVPKQTGNQYEGIAVVRSAKGIDHNVLVQVTVAHKHVTWKTEEPDAFAFLALEQLNPTAPTTGLPDDHLRMSGCFPLVIPQAAWVRRNVSVLLVGQHGGGRVC